MGLTSAGIKPAQTDSKPYKFFQRKKGRIKIAPLFLFKHKLFRLFPYAYHFNANWRF